MSESSVLLIFRGALKYLADVFTEVKRDVDGALSGGASLDPEELAKIA